MNGSCGQAAATDENPASSAIASSIAAALLARLLPFAKTPSRRMRLIRAPSFVGHFAISRPTNALHVPAGPLLSGSHPTQAVLISQRAFRLRGGAGSPPGGHHPRAA